MDTQSPIVDTHTNHGHTKHTCTEWWKEGSASQQPGVRLHDDLASDDRRSRSSCAESSRLRHRVRSEATSGPLESSTAACINNKKKHLTRVEHNRRLPARGWGMRVKYNMYLVCQYLHTTYEYAGPTEHSGEVFCYETVLCHPRMPLLRWRLHNEDDDVPTLAYFPEI